VHIASRQGRVRRVITTTTSSTTQRSRVSKKKTALYERACGMTSIHSVLHLFLSFSSVDTSDLYSSSYILQTVHILISAPYYTPICSRNDPPANLAAFSQHVHGSRVSGRSSRGRQGTCWHPQPFTIPTIHQVSEESGVQAESYAS